MRTTGLCLALVASAQLVLFSSPAFAQDNKGSSDSSASGGASLSIGGSTDDSSKKDDKAAQPAPAAASAGGTVKVHINSPQAVTLQHRASEGAAWETACTSPCDAEVPVGDQYQVTGDGVNPSKPFMLDSSQGKVTLDVTPGSPDKAKVGTYFLVGGGVLALGGAIILIANLGSGFVSSTGGIDDGTTHNAHTNMIWIGGALIFTGIAAGLYGGGTMLANNHSSVDGDVAKGQPSRGANDSAQKAAQLVPPTAPAFILPIVNARF